VRLDTANGPARRMASASLRRAVLVVLSLTLGLALLVGTTGFVLFKNAKVDPLQPADAVVVLGGEHDGREDYGLSLARDGWAPTVVISNPYPAGDSVMQRVCSETGYVEVICLRPSPLTTRGEAEMVRQLATERSWNKIIVVSWRYHLPRARMVFGQCFSDDPEALVMRAVPRPYEFSLARWELIYIYQYAGLLKAALQGDCA
jgi:uncharacterized SAM-binding protein YcdF (DUF218 family)